MAGSDLWMELAGQVALVTGGSRGMGRGAARVGIVSEPGTEEELDETRWMIASDGGDVVTLIADVGIRDDVEEAVTRVRDLLGPIDSLVNNAAVQKEIPFERMEDAFWYQAVSANIHGAYHGSRGVYPEMIRRGDGAILHVSSPQGYRGAFWGTAYCTGTFGLEGFAQSLAQEAKYQNVMVTLAVPDINTKPTSVTESELAALPVAVKEGFVDPIVLAEGFSFLAPLRNVAFAGRRFNLRTLSERIRTGGGTLGEVELFDYCDGPQLPARPRHIF